MIKVDLYKWKTNNIFSRVRLELLPTKICVFFSDKTFSILYKEFINYTYSNSGAREIVIEIPGLRGPMKIVFKSYKKEQYDIICSHLDKYCRNKLEYVVNPMYG